MVSDLQVLRQMWFKRIGNSIQLDKEEFAYMGFKLGKQYQRKLNKRIKG
jgi:hypothetical protein